MGKEIEKQVESTKVWINWETNTTSFQYQEGFERMTFESHDEMIRYVADLAMKGYSVM